MASLSSFRRMRGSGPLLGGASRRALVIGLMQASLAVGAAHVATPALADSSSFWWLDFGGSWNNNWQADNGADMKGDITRNPPSGRPDDHWIVEWSSGGHANNGHNGGYGGTIESTLYGTYVSGKLYTANPGISNTNQWGQTRNSWDDTARLRVVNVTPLALFMSEGGVGGDHDSWRGPGGNGNNVTLYVNASITTNDNKYAGVWVASVGGRSGWGGSDSGRANYLNTSGLSSAGDATAYVYSGASITTNGANAPALIVETIGGDGGGNWNGPHDKWPSYGGSGGWRQGAAATNYSTITTTGASSAAVIVQSIGGKGSEQQADTSSAHNGGGGGDARPATFTNYGTITTSGSDSNGVSAWSVGGLGSSGSQKSTFGSGSYAGDNGSAQTVAVSNQSGGSIKTQGANSYAIMAQSIGGGTAGGYFNPHAGETSAKGGDSGVWGHGGDGSRGGAGGTVNVNNLGVLETQGHDAAALVAQSLGGLGGDGGDAIKVSAFLAVALGGNGGMGGGAGAVNVNNGGGKINTHGESSAAIVAQSIGGGGGNGGVAKAYSVGIIGSVSVAVGGTGGEGGAAGQVSVNNSSAITTDGANSVGIYAQSVGGGGGHGGSAGAVAAAFGAEEFPAVAVAVSVGGSAGSGGHGNAVNVSNTANITTLGVNAYGITGQSIGGGGGDGGGAAGYVLAAATYSLGANASVGASGGEAGHSAAVTLSHNSGLISTAGNGAHGMFGLSVGGGGGSAGNSSAASDIFKAGRLGGAMNLSLGGSGGGGGDGSTVTAKLDRGAQIATTGNFANGVFAQSVGGGGGTGGAADSSAGTGLLFGDTVSDLLADSKVGGIIALQAVVGGKGGSGGRGDAVTVNLNGGSSITTGGPNSHGVYAQSIGGGGGAAGGYSDGGDGRLNVQVNVGGAGGGGGDGGMVTVSNAHGSSIATSGDSSHGVYAESIGGGGGSGGSMTSDKDGGADSANVFVASMRKVMGVDRFQQWVETNKYNDAYETVTGLANLIQDTSILNDYEKKFRSDLISNLYNSKLVQDHNWFSNYFINKGLIDKDGNVLESKEEEESKSMSLTVGVGGKGGSGGNGGIVNVTNDGSISTHRNGSHGAFAHSVGGGGGVGGLASSSNKDGNTINLNVTVGGSGGSGGWGGSVNMSNSGAVTTGGDASYGLFAQAVGGGGGVGGGSIAPETKSFTANFQVGGSGGQGGAGGNITVGNSGSILTAGHESHGIVAQSVGGGGGAATMNLGHNWDDSEDAQKKLDFRIDTTDKIGTILGAGGVRTYKSESEAEKEKRAHAQDEKVKEKLLEAASFTVHIGGTGGTGGVGNSVKVTNTGAITTSGDAAVGILAQSVGGGGGLFSSTGSSDRHHGWNFKFVGHNGPGNNGGPVSVNLLYPGPSRPFGAITTSGAGAHGVLAQSIGGGGGYLGRIPSSASNTIDSNNATGDGGAVTVNVDYMSERISTTGQGANGLYLQSIGGGGGAWANVNDYYNADPTLASSIARPNASGKGGAITVNYSGTISATGQYANGILAQSGKQMTNGAIDPSSSGGPIRITLLSGSIVGGSDKAAGIRIDGGSKDPNNPNQITISGASTVSALSNVAVRAHGAGVNRIELNGKMIGDVVLTDNPGNTTEHNGLRIEGGYYQSRAGAGVVTLGQYSPSGNWLDVWHGGVLDVGGVNNISTLAVTGSMNIAGGRLMIDVDVSPTTGARTNDAISVDNELHHKSMYNGGPSMFVNVVNGLTKGSFDIFNKTPIVDTPLAVSNGGSGSPITWSSTNGGRSITSQAQFVSTASQTFTLSSTENSMLSALQGEWDAGKSTHAQLFGQLANVQSSSDYQKAVTSLGTEGYQAGAGAQTSGASTSMSAAMSCPVFSGTGTTITESQCVWGRVSGARATFDGVRPGHGVKQDDFTYRVGAQWEVAPQWFFGVTGAYVSTDTSTKSGHIRSQGKGGDVSVALKHQMGAWLFAASAHLGYGSYDTAHRISIGSRTWGLNADQDVWTAALRLRAAYQMDFNGFYVRPYVDLDAVHTYAPSFRATGSFMHSFHFAAMREWTVSLSPAVEIGSRINFNDNTWVRPYVTVGGSFLSDPDLTTRVSLGRSGAAFTSTHRMDNKFLDVGAGVQLFTNDMLELRAEYKARIGENYTRHEAVGRMAIKF